MCLEKLYDESSSELDFVLAFTTCAYGTRVVVTLSTKNQLG